MTTVRRKEVEAAHLKSLPQWEDDKDYVVKLKRPVKFAGRMISQGSKVTMKGKIAREFAADILHAEPVAS